MLYAGLLHVIVLTYRRLIWKFYFISHLCFSELSFSTGAEALCSLEDCAVRFQYQDQSHAFSYAGDALALQLAYAQAEKTFHSLT